jgi:integrase-like protein
LWTSAAAIARSVGSSVAACSSSNRLSGQSPTVHTAGATSTPNSGGCMCGGASTTASTHPKAGTAAARSRSHRKCSARSPTDAGAATIARTADPVFAARSGTPLDYTNIYRRVVKPAARRAGVPWAGFHTLRHTCATMLFRDGLNAKQVQLWLGDHSPAFTLAVYVHLSDEDLPDPSFLDTLTRPVTRVQGSGQHESNATDKASEPSRSRRENVTPMAAYAGTGGNGSGVEPRRLENPSHHTGGR